MDNGYNGDFELVDYIVGTAHTITYMTPGLLYRFKIRANNAIGYQSSFSTIQYMMCGTTPASPGSPTLHSQSSSLIYFYWNEPFDNGGTSITQYEIEITKVSTTTITTVSIINSNEYKFSTSEGLSAGETYEFRVRAKNYITEFFGLTGSWSPKGTFYSSDLPQTVTSLTYTGLTKTDATL